MTSFLRLRRPAPDATRRGGRRDLRIWAPLAALLAAGMLAGCGRGGGAAAPAGRPTPLDPATTGAIAGRVLWTAATPPAPAAIDLSGTPACRSAGAPPARDQSLVVNANGTLRWAFAYIQSGLGDRRFATPRTPVVLEQRGCQFEPHVLGLMPGQLLRVVSGDQTVHNVHAEPKLNPAWNDSMLPGGAPIEESFARPEVMIPIRCNVHAWMLAWVGVVANPYFAVTGSDGSFLLSNVPAGGYTLAVWQERLGERTARVLVLPRQTARVLIRFP